MFLASGYQAAKGSICRPASQFFHNLHKSSLLFDTGNIIVISKFPCVAPGYIAKPVPWAKQIIFGRYYRTALFRRDKVLLQFAMFVFETPAIHCIHDERQSVAICNSFRFVLQHSVPEDFRWSWCIHKFPVLGGCRFLCGFPSAPAGWIPQNQWFRIPLWFPAQPVPAR